MEISYENADALVRTIGGTSAGHLGAFVGSLIDKQYSVSYVCQLARHALAFGSWCEARNIALHVLREDHIARYQRYRQRCRSRCFETRRRERHALELLLGFLREEGICSASPSLTSPAEDVVMDFAQYLQHDHGLADITIENYTREARQFLFWRFGQEEVRLRDLRVTDTIIFVQKMSQRMGPHALKRVVTALRSLPRRVSSRAGESPQWISAGSMRRYAGRLM